jgi:5-(carboxyamino)imidazole ribonucleotide mutase
MEEGFFMKKVAVIMGSDSDFPIVKSALAELKKYGVPFECRVMSAHRTPALAEQFARKAKDSGFGVIICAAGMAAHLAGVIAGNTTLPVIGIPIRSSFDGMDALLATVQMPSGIPVATVAVNGAKNAAVLAIQILSLSDEALSAKLEMAKQEMIDGVIAKDKAIQQEIEKL